MAPEALEAAPPIESTEIETVAREVAASCQRAVESRTPLFLLVFYGHEKQKLALLASLRRLLREAGVGNQTLDPRHRPEHAAGKLYEAVAKGGNRCISLLFDLPLSPEGIGYDPAFLAYLNFHRDRIAREKLRMVLLLPSFEAELFTRVAGDLWDFRQHTWWLRAPATVRGEGLWRDLDERSATMLLAPSDKTAIDDQLQRGRALVERTKEPADRAAVLLDLARWLFRRYAAPLALEVALEGLAKGADLPKELQAHLEFEIGRSLQSLARGEEALPHFERSLAFFREVGDRKGEAATLNSIALLYCAWGRFEESLETLEQSLVLHRAIGRNKKGEATALYNISKVYADWGRFEDSLRIKEECLDLFRKAGDRASEAVVLSHIADLYRIQGHFDEALRIIERSLAILRELRDRAGEAFAMNNFALILNALGREDEALNVLKRSLSVFREVGDRPGEAAAEWNLGHSFERRGDLDRAAEFFREAISIEREIGDPAWERHRAHLANLEKQAQAA